MFMLHLCMFCVVCYNMSCVISEDLAAEAPQKRVSDSLQSSEDVVPGRDRDLYGRAGDGPQPRPHRGHCL